MEKLPLLDSPRLDTSASSLLQGTGEYTQQQQQQLQHQQEQHQLHNGGGKDLMIDLNETYNANVPSSSNSGGGGGGMIIDSNNNNNSNNNNKRDEDGRKQLLSSSIYSLINMKAKDKRQILIISEERDALYSYTYDELMKFLNMLNQKMMIDKDKQEHGDQQQQQQPQQQQRQDLKGLQRLDEDDEDDDGESGSMDNMSLKDVLSYYGRAHINKIPKQLHKILEEPCWIDLQGLTDEEIESVGEELGLHPLTVEQILNNDSSEKCEEFPDYLFIICSELSYDVGAELREAFFYIILFKEFIVVFHREPLDCFDNVIKSFRYLGTSSHLSSSEWLLFAFYDSINEGFTLHSDRLVTDVEVLDSFSFQETVEFEEVNLRLGRASRKCTQLLLCLFIKIDILSALLRETISKETEMYLNNVKDKTVRLKQHVKMTEDLLENLKNVFLSKLSLIMNEESHSLNTSMQKFTSLGLIFMPLNLIAGVFGMNMLFPGHIAIDSQYIPFIIIIVTIVTMAISSFFAFRKWRWL
ncbi:hypothetical protein SAMD00019534_087360 [Acytostelium subglobosum LB1]|uniref:hypothetical protein n=1 Tax=Acytostelium subglobosum LB1 TaxID=1410327 RepID=UPI000644AE85|nr:hypothetical protein SAMD00019534_087360 [Acytostelium subglobosum LB1]GAM25561.1 hypothetical protein SAMD00019534_087360 [Acytostelium subglobosum LB1]|eukprot:XP_012751547.1 hypothetical protein SAMD00019534_087360 [Acytostelium subglobosum LB1]